MSKYKGLFTFDVDNHRHLPVEQADGIINQAMIICLEDNDIKEVLEFSKTKSITTAVDIATNLLNIVEKAYERDSTN